MALMFGCWLHHEIVSRRLEPRTLRLLAVGSDQLSYETSAGFLAIIGLMFSCPSDGNGKRTRESFQHSLHHRPAEEGLAEGLRLGRRFAGACFLVLCADVRSIVFACSSISGLVAEYIAAIELARAGFPADALAAALFSLASPGLQCVAQCPEHARRVWAEHARS